jgi:hypothetical protein
MLNSFVLPSSISSGQAIDGVQPIQGFAPYNQLAELMPTFRLAEDGAKPEDEDKKRSDVEAIDPESEEEKSLHEIFRLSFNVSFNELLDYFLIPEQDKIMGLKYKFRNERNVDELTIFPPSGKTPAELKQFRDQLYELQMQLFKTPKGIHCHIIL